VATALVQGLEPGDHILAPDDVYWGLRRVIHDVRQVGADHHLCGFHAARRCSRGDSAEYALVWIETPSNPLIDSDLAALSALVREIVRTRSPFATLRSHADSATAARWASTWSRTHTKYISGHSDVVVAC